MKKRQKKKALKKKYEMHQSAPQQATAASDVMRDAMINIAVESWRFYGRVQRLLLKLDVGEQEPYTNQLRWFIKKVEESLNQADLRIVNVEGQRFDAGMAVTPLNIEEFSADDILEVDQMLEPIIIIGNKGVKMGTVTLRKV